MTSFCAFNAPKLSSPGMAYVGDITLAPNGVAITASGALQVTSGNNFVTVSCLGNSLKTVSVTGATATLAINSQYIINNPPNAGCDLFMPAVGLAALGDMIHVVVFNAGGSSNNWTIHLQSAQNVAVGTAVSNSGTISGKADQKNVITMMCVQQSPEFWVSFNVMGNVIVT